MLQSKQEISAVYECSVFLSCPLPVTKVLGTLPQIYGKLDRHNNCSAQYECQVILPF